MAPLVPAADLRLRLTGTRRRFRLLRGRPALVVGGIMLIVIIVLCVGAPLFAPSSPNAIDPLHPLAAPFTSGHLLGTDEYGRDIWSRILYGGRYDLAIAFFATAVTLVVGTTLGILAGFFGGLVERLIMRTVDLFFAFPFIVLVIAVIAALGPNLLNLFIALWIASWVSYARIANGQTRTSLGYGYVIAAQALGFPRWRVMVRHILPSVLPAAVIFAMVDAVGNVLLGASLGFLGIGIRPPAPEWGAMISDGQNYLLSQWWLSMAPGAALIVLGVSFSLLGDGLADVLRPEQ